MLPLEVFIPLPLLYYLLIGLVFGVGYRGCGLGDAVTLAAVLVGGVLGLFGDA
jgi:hypothetical protein